MIESASRIRHDMKLENREAPQHYSPRYLDRFIVEAYTAHTADEVRQAKSNLADAQQQCLKHIRFLSSIESFHRSVAADVCYDVNEDAYSELVSFLAGVGESLAGLSHQLSFSPPSERGEQ